MQGRLLVVRLSTRDRLCAHVTNLRVQTRIHYPMAFINNLHRETGDGFRRDCETPRLTDSFPERNLLQHKGADRASWNREIRTFLFVVPVITGLIFPFSSLKELDSYVSAYSSAQKPSGQPI